MISFGDVSRAVVVGLRIAASITWRMGHWLWGRMSPRLSFARPTIVVGNVVVGGAGKTPVVMALCRLLDEANCAHAVVALGYGGTGSGGGLRDYGHRAIRVTQMSDPSVVGDESLELLGATNAAVWIGARRGAIEHCVRSGAQVVICDDGLQHPLLSRAHQILVIDAAVGWGDGRVVPWGRCREPPANVVHRVHAVVFTHGSGALIQTEWRRSLASQMDERPCFDLVIQTQWPRYWQNGSWGDRCAKHARLVAFAGLGRPSKFFDALKTIGAHVVACEEWPDHHAYSEGDIRHLIDWAADHQATLVCTLKDAMRLRQWPLDVPLLVASVVPCWHHHDGQRVQQLLNSWRDRKIPEERVGCRTAFMRRSRS